MRATIKKVVKSAPGWLLAIWGTIIVGMIVMIQVAINVAVKGLVKGFSLDGVTAILAAIITVSAGAWFIRNQIKVENNNFKISIFDSRASRAMKNIRIKKVSEGCLDFSNFNNSKFICAWKLTKDRVNIMIKFIRNEDSNDEVFNYLRNEKVKDRWDHRIAIHFDESHNFESEVFHVNRAGKSIFGLNDDEYLCVSQALRYLQQMDAEEMKKCRKYLIHKGLKEANDKYLEFSVFGNAPKLFQLNS